MTLHEYIHQREPARMPQVELQRGEFKLGTTIKVGGGAETLTQVFINEFAGIEYVKKKYESRLYTTDRAGNPRELSCFNLPEHY
jgi:hypothetical protein